MPSSSGGSAPGSGAPGATVPAVSVSAPASAGALHDAPSVAGGSPGNLVAGDSPGNLVAGNPAVGNPVAEMPVPPPPRRPRRRLTHAPVVESLQPDDAATRAGGRVLATIERVRGNVRNTWYQHRTKVVQRKGTYGWDCSGMTSWVLERTAPRALESTNHDRPVARTFFETIHKAPTDRPRRGWQRVAHIEDVQPGDVFAWLRPADWPKGVTGHVGFVVSRPEPVHGMDNAYVLRIADSTRYPHQDDTRAADSSTGFGFGTMLFVADEQGEPAAYGWHGANSRGVVFTDIAFGRVTR